MTEPDSASFGQTQFRLISLLADVDDFARRHPAICMADIRALIVSKITEAAAALITKEQADG